MESSTNKTRTPSRCREWERNRRNKFNDAISRLWETVKQVTKAMVMDNTYEDSENAQYPKIEIVEKAIICLTQCAQEKTQLKAEILALQVKIESDLKKKLDKKDASTQVFIGLNMKKQNGKLNMKVLMLKKSKRNALKEKPAVTTNVTIQPKITQSVITVGTQSTPQNLCMLLPKTSLNDKKGPENTIVVLPAAPYIFPQRPLILPTVPPAFVLVDPNIQSLNKPPLSLVSRNTGDITKTTMVNILPISAYSRPLSAHKSKKNNMKAKVDISKKTVKKAKSATKAQKDSECDKDTSKTTTVKSDGKETKDNEANTKDDNVKVQVTSSSEKLKNSDQNIDNKENKTTDHKNIDKHNVKEINVTSESKAKPKSKDIEAAKVTNTETCIEIETLAKTTIFSNTKAVQETDINVENINKSAKPNKITSENAALTCDKEKENKLPNILETTLCENVVDGGNARLELAEEFLAASPTAAFLMTFPLVSGNRADSPAPCEEPNSTIQVAQKDTSERRSEIDAQPIPYFEKPNENKAKPTNKTSANIMNKQNEHNKYIENNVTNKQLNSKASSVSTTANNIENPFLNLTMPTLVSTTCTLADSTYGVDFDCNISKPVQSQSTSYPGNNNIFYKGDPFSTVKSTIYSTSSISSGHEFNSFGLYPCAMEKYASKNKSDYSNVDDSLMKIGSSRLTYDIDLGWSHKSFDFVSCTSAPNTFNKDNALTTTAGTYSTSYNPFNPEFHVPLASNSNKKDNTSNKTVSSIADTITSFYSQPTNLWSEDVPFYTNNNVSKSLASKHQNYLPLENMQVNVKPNISKQYDIKQNVAESDVNNVIKPSNISVGLQMSDKFTKKSPSKMHINWMTSEVRPMQNNCIPSHADLKETHKSTYLQPEQIPKKQEQHESNYFPISMHNFTSQPTQDELQVWPSSRPGCTTEISIEPPPINLPTLVGDLALGPHEKKKNIDASRSGTQPDIQNCSNFFSVTQLMNRTTDTNIASRYQEQNVESSKSIPTKQSINHISETARKPISRLESHIPQPCYVFNDLKTTNSFDTMSQYSQPKTKSSKVDKSSKTQKNSYSAESLLRGGTCTQKIQDNNTRYLTPTQKYNDYNVPTDSSIAHVSHFPPILDYTENGYTAQQFSGTTLYNSTTNTISNSFYSNFMPGSGNLMPTSNYSGGPFSGDFIDYNQTTECNYSTHKYEELKMRNNPAVFQQDKVPTNYKSSRRESTAKHKLECSKKESSKKYQNKRPKLHNEIEEWPDSSHLLWQNKTSTKRHSNLMPEELPFPNYVGNQMTSQYQPDFFNSHLMPSNMQGVTHNVDRSLTSFPVSSRANFNLSTIFPEITMKVQ